MTYSDVGEHFPITELGTILKFDGAACSPASTWPLEFAALNVAEPAHKTSALLGQAPTSETSGYPSRAAPPATFVPPARIGSNATGNVSGVSFGKLGLVSLLLVLDYVHHNVDPWGTLYKDAAAQSPEPAKIAEAKAATATFAEAAAGLVSAVQPVVANELGDGSVPAPQHGRFDGDATVPFHGDATVDALAPDFQPPQGSHSFVVAAETAGTAGTETPVLAAGRAPELSPVSSGELGVFMHGTSGDDVLIGTAGNDVLIGGAGSDLLIGGSGDDVLLGEDGNDILIGDGDNGDLAAVAAVLQLIQTREKAQHSQPEPASTGTSETHAAHASAIEPNSVAPPSPAPVAGSNGVGPAFQGEAAGFQVAPGMSALPDAGETELGHPASSNASTPSAADPAIIADPAAANALFEQALARLLDGSQADIILLDHPKGHTPVPMEPNSVAGGPVSSNSRVPWASPSFEFDKHDEGHGAGPKGGNDVIDGGRGNDIIIGGRGDDTLTGGHGDDTFIFRHGFGHDVITDFNWSPGNHDVIYFEHGMFADFDDFAAHSMQVDSSVVISVDANDDITLQHVDKINLSAHDSFVFA